jgi:hypothetical protein
MENKSQLEFGMFDKAMQVGKIVYINDHNFGFPHATFFTNTKGSYGTKALPPLMEKDFFLLGCC